MITLTSSSPVERERCFWTFVVVPIVLSGIASILLPPPPPRRALQHYNIVYALLEKKYCDQKR